MYHEHFGLHESPFALTPDPRYLFMSDAHKEALASMIYGVQERKGFVLILGEVGTGKTTLIRHLLGHFGDDIRTVYIFNTLVTFDELLRATLRELELPCPSRQRVDMIETLNEYLIQETAAGRFVVLIIDEAQHLSPEVLEDLRMLSNLETARSKLLQIILVGQPELGQKLARPGLRQLRQRIGLVAELGPLGFAETVRYVNHRLEVAGLSSGRLFTQAALRRIHAASGGIPRLVNVLCDKALLLAYGDGARQVRRRIVRQVARDWTVFGRAPGTSEPVQKRLGRRRPAWSWGRVAAATAMVVLGVPLAVLGARQMPGMLAGVTPPAAVGPVRSPAPAANLAPASRPAPGAPVTAPAPRSAPVAAVPAPGALPAPAVEVSRTSAPAPDLSSERRRALDTGRAAVDEPRPAVLAPRMRGAVVRPGDTLGALVQDAYGRADFTLIDHVRMANPWITDVNLIEIGRRIVFPTFEPAQMVHRQGAAAYVVHVATISLAGTRTLDRLRSTAAAQRRKVYVVPVRFTTDFEVYRVLIGDFEDQAQAESFSRAFRPPSGLSNSLWG